LAVIVYSMTGFEFELPAVEGMQAGREYYITMCPLRLLAKLFPDSMEGPAGQHHSGRTVNRVRVPEITRYILENRTSYALGALTASISTTVVFQSWDEKASAVRSGKLRVPMSAQFVLHDGIHRCAALQAAVRRAPELGDETISLVLFIDPDLQRSEQVFTDLKQHERKLPRSLSILHDTRDETARLTRQVIQEVEVFGENVEMARTTISNRSRKLFTLSAVYQATKTLLADQTDATFDEKLRTASGFWSEVAKHIVDWRQAVHGQVSPAELRKQYVHSHGIALAALGRVGRTLLAEGTKRWRGKLRGLKTLDWRRSNSPLWEGRAMIAGRLSKASSCVVLTGNAIKTHLGLPLTRDEIEIERQFRKRGKR
jgi:DNA sulfur modification protein DndB